MKKILLILSLLAGVTLQSKAQHFIASFGVEHDWDIPSHISSAIYHDYHGYDWVHSTRIHREGSLFFDVVLQHGDIFVEVSVRRDGYITRRVVREYYPLHDHVCGNYCGYHSNYYRTYYRSCHSHHHHGHNHVVYVNRPVHHHSYNHYSHNTYYGYGKHNGGHYKHGNGHGHGKGHHKQYSAHHNEVNDHNDGHYRERRDRYHDSDDRHYDRDNSKGRSKNSSNGRAVYVRRGH